MGKQYFDIIDGVYVGPEVWEGGLDLHPYKDTLISLGSLKEVVGCLNLMGCSSLTSLGALKEVGCSLTLNLRGTPTPPQKVQERVFYYSSLPSHKALSALHTDEVQETYLYKNILLQTLQGGQNEY